jgi:hypothetical protein
MKSTGFTTVAVSMVATSGGNPPLRVLQNRRGNFGMILRKLTGIANWVERSLVSRYGNSELQNRRLVLM